MDCEEHKNSELANCPSCLAQYWEHKYNQVKSEKNTVQLAFDDLRKADESFIVLRYQKALVSFLKGNFSYIDDQGLAHVHEFTKRYINTK